VQCCSPGIPTEAAAGCSFRLSLLKQLLLLRTAIFNGWDERAHAYLARGPTESDLSHTWIPLIGL